MNSSLRIAIIGAGPGGLTLARILQNHDVNVTVYEREPSATSRQQGGTLDLHGEGGLTAIRAAGLMDEFQKYARPEGEHTRILDKDGRVWLDHDSPMGRPSDEGRPEIDRTHLRQILLDSLATGTIKWGHNLLDASKCSQEEDGAYKLKFENIADDIVTDLVIGADGAWSRIRPLVHTDPADAPAPKYTGISFIDLRIDDVDRFPEVSKLIGLGTALIVTDNKGLIAQRNSGGRARVYVALRVAEDWLEKESGISFDGSDPDSSLKAILALFPGWHPTILETIRRSDRASIVPRKIYAMPIGYKWTTKPGVTLLGDAAHLMSPFAGEGVNLAMIDGHDLAFAILRAVKGAPIGEALKNYEEIMSSRGQEKAQESADNIDLFFHKESPQPLLALMASHHGVPS